MIDKNFIVTELEFEELEDVLENKLNEFIRTKFGELAFKQTNCSVNYQEYMDEGMKCFKDEFRCEIWIEVEFTQYTYKVKPKNGEEIERIESIGMMLEYKGRQPFYIDGKFVSMNVFEWIQGCPIQKHEKIYGVKKDELYDLINDLVMDC
jgi:hypothetical protein